MKSRKTMINVYNDIKENIDLIVKRKKLLFIHFKTLCLASLGLIFSILVDPVKADVSGDPSVEIKKDIKKITRESTNIADDDLNILPKKPKKTNSPRPKLGSEDKNQPTILLKGVSFSGNKEYNDGKLLNYFKDLIGQKVTFQEINDTVNKIQAKYRNEGFITTQVVIPKQNFNSGYLKISIIESYIEDIIVSGGNKGTRSYVKYMTKELIPKDNKNKIFKFDELERQLLLIRRTGVANLTSTLSKGSKKGGSILTIKLDKIPYSTSIFTNTHLSEKLGDYQVGIRNTFTTKTSKPIKVNSLAKYAFPVEDGLLGGVVSFEKPIAYKGLSLSALYAYTKTETKDLFPDVSGDSINKGDSEYISLSLGYPIILKRNTALNVDIGTSIQNSKSDFYLNGVETNNVSTDRIRAARLGINGRRDLRNSANYFKLEISQGIDGWDNEISSTEYKSDLNAKANFTKYKLDVVRQQYIPIKKINGLNLEFKASAQLAEGSLPVPEKLSFGGYEFGKGFRNSHIFGDEGWVSSIKLSKNIRNSIGIVTPYLWYDYGSTSDLEGTKDDYTASTIGIGVGGKFNKNSTYDLSIGFPATDESNTDEVGSDHKILGFNLSYSF